MSDDPRTPPPGPTGVQELDELQRGQDEPLTVETLEQAAPAYGEQGRREIPIPHPGERPGAVRIADERAEAEEQLIPAPH
jgi:hypothetical protein